MSWWRSSQLAERVRYHLARARAWARRATAVSLSIRGLIWLAGIGALLLALPPPLRASAALPAAVVFAGLAGALPGTGWVSAVEMSVVGIVALTATVAAPPSLLEVGLIGALLYLHHTAAALAAQLRTDAVIPAAVVRHWAGRAGAVLAAAAALGLGIATLPAQAPVWSATGLVILGAASAVTVAAALAYLLHRRSAP